MTSNNPFQANTPPDTSQDQHKFSDVDSSPQAQHHTLGTGPNQAAKGDHTHSVNDGPWTNLTLTNGWVNYGGLYAPAGYYKDALGWVHLRGLIKDGVLGQFAVLPVGVRPQYQIRGSTVSYNGTNHILGIYSILQGGGLEANTGSGTVFFSLDGITFKAA